MDTVASPPKNRFVTALTLSYLASLLLLFFWFPICLAHPKESWQYRYFIGEDGYRPLWLSVTALAPAALLHIQRLLRELGAGGSWRAWTMNTGELVMFGTLFAQVWSPHDRLVTSIGLAGGVIWLLGWFAQQRPEP